MNIEQYDTKMNGIKLTNLYANISWKKRQNLSVFNVRFLGSK